MTKKCIKENLKNTIHIYKTPNNRFYSIFQVWYESNIITLLFDINNFKIYKFYFDTIDKIEVWKNWVYVLYSLFRWDLWWIIFLNKSVDDFSWKIFGNAEWEHTIKTIDFELMANKKIKVFYKKWEDKTLYQKIIDIWWNDIWWSDKTYISKKYSFEIKYPNTLNLIETTEETISNKNIILRYYVNTTSKKWWIWDWRFDIFTILIAPKENVIKEYKEKWEVFSKKSFWYLWEKDNNYYMLSLPQDVPEDWIRYHLPYDSIISSFKFIK